MNAIDGTVTSGPKSKGPLTEQFDNSDYIPMQIKSMAFREFLNDKDRRLNEQWLISKKKETFTVDPKDPARRSSLMPMYNPNSSFSDNPTIVRKSWHKINRKKLIYKMLETSGPNTSRTLGEKTMTAA